MYTITDIVIVLKALHTSVQHEVNWWAWRQINVVQCNSLNKSSSVDSLCLNKSCTFEAFRYNFELLRAQK